MAEPEKQSPPMDISELADFISAFDEATVKLKESHDKLRAKADELAGELSVKNRELQAKIEEVSALKNYLTNILESITDGVLTVNTEDKISALNDTAAGLFPEAALAGQPVAELRAGPFCKVIEILTAAMNDNTLTASRVVEINTDEGILRSLSVSASPLKDSNGEIIGAVATFRDNTDVRHLELTLQRKERLAALGQMAAQLAHEIRNPLGGIELYASLLERSLAEKPEERELSKKIISATSSLNRLVEDMLTFARPSELQKVKVNPSSLLDCAAELVFASFQGSAISVTRDYMECEVMLDPDLMQRAFMNVIFNAVQFMEEKGELRLSAHVAENDKGSILILKISDTGPGVPANIKEQVFNPFFTRRENGTGLGLAIVQKIIQDHEGTVFIEDNLPHGAVFVFEFKL
ncbi:MAG: two-component system sensor histidine kinase NtrB [Planctomycetota bacterium]|jgi:PAS domain S-box-containing protein